MKTKKQWSAILFAVVIFLSGLSFVADSAKAKDCMYLDTNGNAAYGSGAFCDGQNQSAGLTLQKPDGIPGGTILGILQNFLNWLLMVFAILGILGFVLSGIFYLLAGADEGNLKKGKEGMKWSIVGIIVGLSGYIVMVAAQTFLSGNGNF